MVGIMENTASLTSKMLGAAAWLTLTRQSVEGELGIVHG